MSQRSSESLGLSKDPNFNFFFKKILVLFFFWGHSYRCVRILIVITAVDDISVCPSGCQFWVGWSRVSLGAPPLVSPSHSLVVYLMPIYITYLYLEELQIIVHPGPSVWLGIIRTWSSRHFTRYIKMGWNLRVFGDGAAVLVLVNWIGWWHDPHVKKRLWM